MELVVYTQDYRCKSADRQLEIDECLQRNLNYHRISKVMLFKEVDAPPLPQSSVPLEVVESHKRITYPEWFCWLKRQGSNIGLLLNASIDLDEGQEQSSFIFNYLEPNNVTSLHSYILTQQALALISKLHSLESKTTC
jgi:hypothetical protein